MLHPIAAEVIEMIEAIETANLSPEELAAAMRAVGEKIAAHPDVESQLPPGFAASIIKASDDLDRSTANAKEMQRRVEIAEQNRQIAQASLDRLADQLLHEQSDQNKGN